MESRSERNPRKPSGTVKPVQRETQKQLEKRDREVKALGAHPTSPNVGPPALHNMDRNASQGTSRTPRSSSTQSQPLKREGGTSEGDAGQTSGTVKPVQRETQKRNSEVKALGAHSTSPNVGPRPPHNMDRNASQGTSRTPGSSSTQSQPLKREGGTSKRDAGQTSGTAKPVQRETQKRPEKRHHEVKALGAHPTSPNVGPPALHNMDRNASQGTSRTPGSSSPQSQSLKREGGTSEGDAGQTSGTVKPVQRETQKRNSEVKALGAHSTSSNVGPRPPHNMDRNASQGTSRTPGSSSTQSQPLKREGGTSEGDAGQTSGTAKPVQRETQKRLEKRNREVKALGAHPTSSNVGPPALHNMDRNASQGTSRTPGSSSPQSQLLKRAGGTSEGDVGPSVGQTSGTVKRVKQETQQTSALNPPDVPPMNRNARPPKASTTQKVKKKKKPNLVTKLKEKKRLESRHAMPPTQFVTPEQMQEALGKFNEIRLNLKSKDPFQALKIMNDQYPELFFYSEGKSGSLPGVNEGTKVRYTAELKILGIHLQPRKGIAWKEVERSNRDTELRAVSVVDSGKYDSGDAPGDAAEVGETVIYTGEGGRHPITGLQIDDQEFEGGNTALKNSMHRHDLVRFVKRDSSGDNDVLTYHGLYKVQHCHRELVDSKSVIKFTLVKDRGQAS